MNIWFRKSKIEDISGEIVVYSTEDVPLQILSSAFKSLFLSIIIGEGQ